MASERIYTPIAPKSATMRFNYKIGANGEDDRETAMNNENSNAKPGSNPDPLSATEMFLRTMETTPGAARTSEPSSPQPIPSAQPEAPAPASGEFTQFFRPLTVPEPPPSQPNPPAQPHVAAPAPAVSAAPLPPAQLAAAAPASGEFTQFFRQLTVPEAAPPQPPVQRPQPSAERPIASDASAHQPAGEYTQFFFTNLVDRAAAPAQATPPSATAPQLPGSKGRGFSAPGVSDSASADGSFTSFMRAHSAGTESGPAAPSSVASAFVASAPSAIMAATPPDSEARSFAAWQPVTSPTPAPATAPPAESVTHMIEALSSPTQAPLRSQPVPYRSEPVATPSPTAGSTPFPHQAAAGPLETGGVTRMIEALSSAPAPAAPPLAQRPEPVAPPPSQGPGEFTRIIFGLEAGSSADPQPQPQPAAPSPAFHPQIPAAPMPAAGSIAVPPMPQPRPPAAPIPAYQQPAFAPQPAPAVAPPQLPAAPKPASVPTKKKSGMEPMIPILLAFIAVLLVAVLVLLVVILNKH